MDNAYALVAFMAVLAFLSCLIIVPILIVSRVTRAVVKSTKKTARSFRQ